MSTSIFCQRTGASPQNYIYSGIPEIQQLLNSFSLSFNPDQNEKYTLNTNIVQILQSLDGSEKYKSRSKFNQIQAAKLNSNPEFMSNILALQEYPYKVISSVYGCNHDFMDVQTAQLAYEKLSIFCYPNFVSLDRNTQTVLSQFKKGVPIINTSTLDNIWEKTQEDIEKLLEALNFSFPTINFSITRQKVDTSTEEIKNESKELSKHIDFNNIISFLNEFNIVPQRLVWVIDTFQSWLESISSNKLYLNNSIAVIDGASASLSGNIVKPCASLNYLEIGPYLFHNNGTNIEIYDSSRNIIARCAYGASVTTIINTISQLGRDLSGASRSNVGSQYVIEWVTQLSDNEKILLLEFIKAAGDQAPVDICKKCLEQEDINGESDNSILIFSTGDILAFQMAKSLGIPAFFISSSKILFTIPSCVISLDLATPTLINFLVKFNQMFIFYKHINLFFNEFIKYVNKLENISSSGQIMAIQLYIELGKYFNKIKEDTDKMMTAYQYLDESVKNPNSIDIINKFYFYLKNNLNNINFSPDSLYDFLFASKSNEYNGYTYNSITKSFSLVELNPNLPPENDDDSYKVAIFCDNFKYNQTTGKSDCRLDNSTHVKDKPVEYLRKVCSIGDTKCIESYQTEGLLPIPTPVPKNYVYKNLIADEGQIDEGFLMVGEIYEIEYQRDINRSFKLNNLGMPIKTFKKMEGNVPLNVLENIIQSTLIDLLWEIPYEAFIIPMKQSGQIDFQKFMNKIKYIFKTLEICLTDLYVEQEYLILSIKYVLLGFISCPPVAIDENGIASNISDTPIDSNNRSRRGKSGIIGTQMNWQQGKENISNFFIILFQYCDVDKIINIIINVKTNKEFLDLKLETFVNTSVVSQEVITQFFVQTYENLYSGFFGILNEKKQTMIDKFNNLLAVSSQLNPSFISHVKSILTTSSGGKNKNKGKNKKSRKQKNNNKKTLKKGKSKNLKI